MANSHRADAVRLLGSTIGRAVDVVIVNTAPSPATPNVRAQENKAPLEIGDAPVGVARSGPAVSGATR